MAKLNDNIAAAFGWVDKLAKRMGDAEKSSASFANNMSNAAKGGGSNPGGGSSGTVATPNFTPLSGGGGFGSQLLGGLGNFAMSLPGVVAQALPSPATAAAYQLSTARQGFFSGMGFGNAAQQQRSMSSGGTAISAMDAVQAISALQSSGIYNTGQIGRGVAALSNYEPGLGLAGTAQAAASFNQGRSVNLMNAIGIQVRGANGMFRDPNQIANDFVDKIYQSTPPLKGNARDAYAYLIGSLQPGNQLYAILNTYIQDANLRQIIIDKLFAKAKGLPGTPSKEQLTEAGLYTKVTGAQSGYNTSQLGLTQATQADINRGTAAALVTLTKATNEFAGMISKQHSLLYGIGYGSTMMGGMNGAVGTLIGSLMGNVIGPILGKALGGIGKSISSALGGGLKGLAGALGGLATAAFAGVSGYKGGQNHHWSWGNFLTSALGGAAAGSAFGPEGALIGLIGGAATYGGGYAMGTQQNKTTGLGAGASASISLQNASPAATAALMTAASQLGTPYSWGGGGIAGPTRGFNQGSTTVGFDCSSFVQYVFAKQGINLPRTTYYQVKAGIGVDPMNARPGDLLFWGAPTAPHHVAIYMGNGKIIQAPHTGGEVEIANVDLRGVSVARRVLGAGSGNNVNWSTVIGNTSGLAASGMSSVPGYNDAAMTMASGGVTGAFGTITSTAGWGTKLGGGGGYGDSSEITPAASATYSPSNGAGTIIVNVTVPPTTDPKHVKATTKAVTDAINKTKNTHASRTN